MPWVTWSVEYLAVEEFVSYCNLPQDCSQGLDWLVFRPCTVPTGILSRTVIGPNTWKPCIRDMVGDHPTFLPIYWC